MSDEALSPLLRPELGELFVELANIGVGRAAAAMSDLAQKEVKISVPSVEVIRLRNAQTSLRLEEGPTLRVSQLVTGGLQGQALVLLSRAGAVRLASLMLGRTDESDAFDEAEQAALLELGNIMIGGVIGTLANQFQDTIGYEVPRLYLRGASDAVELIFDLVRPDCTDVLVMQARLSIDEIDVRSYFLLLLEDERLQSLAAKLERLLQGTE
jgi:chemotaxis protein CheC